MIALTFDDGPNEPYTRQILDVLAEYGAKATFFVIGKWVKVAPALAWDIVRNGHDLGNHTYSHHQASRVSEDKWLDDVVACDRALGEIGITCPKWFRAPFGDTENTIPWMHVTWDIHGSDWAADSVEEITEPIFAYLDEHKAGIVLLHDGYYKEFGYDRSKTVEATRRILERYKSEKFVTVSEYKQ